MTIQNHLKKRPLVECFKDFIDECRYVKNLRPRTIKSYSDSFNLFIRLVPEAYAVKDLNKHCFTAFSKQLKLRKDKAPVKDSTLRTYHTNILIFVRYLEKNGYVERGSITEEISRPPMPQYNDSRALSKQEVSTIMSAIMLHTLDDEFLYIRDLTIMNILLYTGIRKGELLGLRVSDVDFAGKTIFINHESSKSKKSRYIPLHPVLRSQLKTYFVMRKNLGIETDALLVSKKGTAITSHCLKHFVERYSKKSGIKFHLHRCRHTFACNLSMNNTDLLSIRNLMGHTNITMTERYLRSIQNEMSRNEINKLSF